MWLRKWAYVTKKVSVCDLLLHQRWVRYSCSSTLHMNSKSTTCRCLASWAWDKSLIVSLLSALCVFLERVPVRVSEEEMLEEWQTQIKIGQFFPFFLSFLKRSAPWIVPKIGQIDLPELARLRERSGLSEGEAHWEFGSEPEDKFSSCREGHDRAKWQR